MCSEHEPRAKIQIGDTGFGYIASQTCALTVPRGGNNGQPSWQAKLICNCVGKLTDDVSGCGQSGKAVARQARRLQQPIIIIEGRQIKNTERIGTGP